MAQKQTGTYAEKESIVKRLNERMRSTVRKVGTDNEDYIRWATKLSRPGSPYVARTTTYKPDKIQLSRNRGAVTNEVTYLQLSRRKADIESMDINALLRLEQQTRGWGAIRKEAAEAINEQRRELDLPEEDYNPFEFDSSLDFAAAEPLPVTDEEIKVYLNQKEAVRQFIESHSEAFYALIDATGWDDIRDHTTAEIYREAQKIDIGTYQFSGTLTEIGDAYISRRDKAREARMRFGFV